MEEKISVLIPAYNRERFIGECIDSILAQTYRNIQIIVYDDGSRDRTASIVRSYANVKLIEGGVNKGVSHSRNELLRACDTRYAAWQDSDDIAAPDRIEELYKKIKETEKALVYCHCIFMNNMKRNVSADNILCMGGVMFDMEKVRDTFFNEKVTMGAEDNLWLAKIGKEHGEPALVPSRLYYVRIHPDRISNWKRKPENSHAREQSDRVYREEMRRMKE